MEQAAQQEERMTRLLESIAVNYPARAEYVSPPKPKISTFNEKTDDVKSFVNRFETIANALRWPKEVWGSNWQEYCQERVSKLSGILLQNS